MRCYRLLMIIGLVILVVLGLNTSNQGINNLTREERGAVLDLDRNGSSVVLEAIGNSYYYSLDKLAPSIPWVKDKGQGIITGWIEYLKKIWIIFDAVFLYE